MDLDATVRRLTGARHARRADRLQSLWKGYGEVVRYTLDGASVPAVVVKCVQPPADRGLSHRRKLRSYAVEQCFYTRYAPRFGGRLARVWGAEELGAGWVFVFEDLVAAGLSPHHPGPRDAILRWLARFHATFLGDPGVGLWETGSYWHLATRPDELAQMAPGPLRDAARALDARLAGARFQTLVHGDAKPANFLGSEREVAAVDFQYVGRGPGVRDLAYTCRTEDRHDTERQLAVYFAALRTWLPDHIDADALEDEWRALFPVAWADYQRFLAGWAPDWPVPRHCHALTRQALQRL